MKLRSFFLTLAGAVTVLLLLAAGSLNWILAQSPLNLVNGGVMKNPTAAVFIPRQAPLMVSLLVNPEGLQAFGELAAPLGKRGRTQTELNQLKKSLLANTGLNYQKDIKPWLGDELTLAVTSLDYDRDSKNGIKPGYLLAVKADKPEVAREFLQASYSQQAISPDVDLVFEQYKGVNIVYKRNLNQGKNSIASAVVGDLVLFANHPRVLREAIGNVDATELNLQNFDAYQEALKTITEPRIGVGYFNLPAVSAWITNSSEPESLDVKQTLTLALSLQPFGLKAATALIGLSGEDEQTPALSAPVGGLQYVPDRSILTVAGTDLNKFWQLLTSGLEVDSPLQQLLKTALNRIEAPLGLSLPQDIFSWVKGEYALSLLPAADQKKLDWVFVAQNTPDTNVNEAITHLDQLAKNQQLSLGDIQLGDQKVTVWTQLVTDTQDKSGFMRLKAQVKGLHTQVENYQILSSSLAAIEQIITLEGKSLVNTERFEKAIAPLPKENNGYLYLDWNQGEQILEQQFPLVRVVELAAKPLFNHLQSLSLTSLGSKNGVRRASIFFDLE